MVAHRPSEPDGVPPVRRRGFESRIPLINARSVTAAQWHSGPYWGIQPLSSGSIPDGRANYLEQKRSRCILLKNC